MSVQYVCLCRLWNTTLLREDTRCCVGHVQASQMEACSRRQTLGDQASASRDLDTVRKKTMLPSMATLLHLLMHSLQPRPQQCPLRLQETIGNIVKAI